LLKAPSALVRLLWQNASRKQPERNPFLERFYHNQARWALATQICFLYQRIDQATVLAGTTPNTRGIVSDFLLEKDPLFAALNLPADELALYQRLFDAIKPQVVRKPDLPETLIGRVHQRGMDAERRITESYLERVAERYARFFYEYDAAPLFIVDAEILNPIDQDDDFELLLDRLRNMRSYREFFGYAA